MSNLKEINSIVNLLEKENTYFIPLYEFTIPLGLSKAVILSELLKQSASTAVKRDKDDLNYFLCTTSFLKGDLYKLPEQTIQYNLKKLKDENYIYIDRKYYDNIPYRMIKINYSKVYELYKDWKQNRNNHFKDKEDIFTTLDNELIIQNSI